MSCLTQIWFIVPSNCDIVQYSTWVNILSYRSSLTNITESREVQWFVKCCYLSLLFFLFESWLLRFNCRVDTNDIEPALQETWSAGGSKWQQEVTVWHSWRYLRLFRHFSCKPTDMNSIKISASARCYFEPSDWYCSEAPHMSDSVDSSGPHDPLWPN